MTPPASSQSIVIVGAGIFGVTAAVELRRRGYQITLCDPGPVPHSAASSTDISKMIRMDYGRDEFYMDLMEEALAGWDRWNRDWKRPLYHEDGFVLLSKSRSNRSLCRQPHLRHPPHRPKTG